MENKEDTFGNRLSKIREVYLNIRKYAVFSEYLGGDINPQMLKKYEDGESMPSAYVIARVAEKVPNINIHWLLSGVGRMFREIDVNSYKELEDRVKELQQDKANMQLTIDLFKQSVA